MVTMTMTVSAGTAAQLPELLRGLSPIGTPETVRVEPAPALDRVLPANVTRLRGPGPVSSPPEAHGTRRRIKLEVGAEEAHEQVVQVAAELFGILRTGSVPPCP